MHPQGSPTSLSSAREEFRGSPEVPIVMLWEYAIALESISARQDPAIREYLNDPEQQSHEGRFNLN